MHSLTGRVKGCGGQFLRRKISTTTPMIATITSAWIPSETPLPPLDAAESIARNTIEQPKKSTRLQRMIFLSKGHGHYWAAAPANL